ncbi:hypothetical protein [Umezawaea sp. Da 62-37]|uniref:hypothetical protein n=1 Tax=Umezawaea sp. Da 62-37 TaxID=3075927 RepID=UPI0028F72B0A|nr:hypothetical protein [Umezawaea sp. Da 62-37]WNV87968.1 hypothetical protein RM788_06680 [Umezawaea sp. Da 62-37]
MAGVNDTAVRTGDFLRVTIPPPALVPLLQAPGVLRGSGLRIGVLGKPVCLEGDELPDAFRAVMPYTAPPFVTPGTGRLQITLLPTNKSLRTRSGGRSILLRGTVFTALFQVVSPAMQPTPVGPIPDPVLVKPGTAQFVTDNATVRLG